MTTSVAIIFIADVMESFFARNLDGKNFVAL